jgi:hypothetical protein
MSLSYSQPNLNSITDNSLISNTVDFNGNILTNVNNTIATETQVVSAFTSPYYIVGSFISSNLSTL